MNSQSQSAGVEWIIEAYGCNAAALQDISELRLLFERLVSDLDLRPIGQSVWHRFPQTGGLTGFQLLTESHLACHTFPEHQSLCLNVFCCRPRPDWNVAGLLETQLGARSVRVRKIERGYDTDAAARTRIA